LIFPHDVSKMNIADDCQLTSSIAKPGENMGIGEVMQALFIFGIA